MINKCKKIYKKNEEIINYLIVGGLTTLISLLTYYLCVNTFLNPSDGIQLQIANIITWIVGVSFAYVTNRIFTFKSKEKNIVKECMTFVGSRILTLLLDMFVMFLLVTIFGWNDKISKIISQILVIMGNYIISKFVVFDKKKSWE